MPERDTYDTTNAPERRVSIKVQRSEFIAVVFPVDEEETFVRSLARLQKEFHDATHHCWAWRLREGDSVREMSSDAGEPSGTAGRPILQAIESAELLDIGVVVVRYFGGIKLGTGGLARAYRDAARSVLREVPRETGYLYSRITVEVPYSSMSHVYRLISPPDVLLVSEEFGEPNRFTLDVRLSRVDAIEEVLREKRLDVVVG